MRRLRFSVQLALAIAFGATCGIAYLVTDRAQAQAPTVLSPVTSTFTQTTAATSAAIPSNPARKQLQICGVTATNTLNYTFGTPVVTPTSALGIPLAAQTCVTFTPTAGSYMGSQVNMIAITGSVVVVWTEWF